MSTVYLLAPLGTSPAVVTETLWHLAVAEGHTVLAVELWLTHSDDGHPATSLQSLRARVAQGLWTRLQAAAGPCADRLPPLPDRFPVHPPEPDRPVAPGLLAFGFQRDRLPLPDIRDPADATAVADQLHARVRFLCRALGPTVLVGSIAGGRKNLGPSLQGAFELQARPSDRLVHVLLHPVLEADKPTFLDYVAPERTLLGVPPDRQLAVFDVPFPPLRHLLPDGAWREALNREDVASLWDRLRANLADAAALTARLAPSSRSRWKLVIARDGRPVHRLDLSGGEAETYAALVAVPPDRPGQLEEWGDYIHAHRLGRQSADPQPPTIVAVTKRLSDLAKATRPLFHLGLSDFAVHLDAARTRIPAADRVTLPAAAAS